MLSDLAGAFFDWLYTSYGRLKCKLRRKHNTIYIKIDKKHICLDCDYERAVFPFSLWSAVDMKKANPHYTKSKDAV